MENNSDNETQRGQTPLKNEGGFTMTTKERYESAKEIYGKIGVDTDKVLETLKSVPISMHCWQGMMLAGLTVRGHLQAVSRLQEIILVKQEHRKN